MELWTTPLEFKDNQIWKHLEKTILKIAPHSVVPIYAQDFFEPCVRRGINPYLAIAICLNNFGSVWDAIQHYGGGSLNAGSKFCENLSTLFKGKEKLEEVVTHFHIRPLALRIKTDTFPSKPPEKTTPIVDVPSPIEPPEKTTPIVDVPSPPKDGIVWPEGLVKMRDTVRAWIDKIQKIPFIGKIFSTRFRTYLKQIILVIVGFLLAQIPLPPAAKAAILGSVDTIVESLARLLGLCLLAGLCVSVETTYFYNS